MSQSPSQYDYLIKLLLLGDSGVGKSCLLIRFSENTFTTSFITTIGIDFKIRTIELDGKKIKIQIWDSGNERFRFYSRPCYRGAMGILLTYDVTDEQSFQRIGIWKKSIDENADPNVNIILIGNKCDLFEKTVVDTSKGQQLADELGMPFFETSAKYNINVENAFFAITRDVLARLQGIPNPQKDFVAPFEGGCC